MPSTRELIAKRRKELLAKGYPPGIVNLAMEWAQGSAQGMANYGLSLENSDNPGEDLETMANRFLPRYLKDAENWIKAFGYEPTVI